MNSKRLDSVDIARGLIMVFMALDHAAIMIGGPQHYVRALTWLSTESHYFHGVLPFLTRYLPALCPTGFSFLTGLCMVLFYHARRQVGWGSGRCIAYYAKRGLL